MMAKREGEMKEIRAKTTEEMNDKLVDVKGKLFMLEGLCLSGVLLIVFFYGFFFFLLEMGF